MKFQYILLVLAILKECLSNITIPQTQKYNFPLEIQNSNTIYLRDYTLNLIEAPYYKLLNSSQFDLKIDQAISEIFNTNSDDILEQSVRIGTNYIALSGVTSNSFWVLTQDDKLYKGLIQNNGELQMTFLDIMISKQYFQINLITNDFAMLSSLNDGELFFTLINSTSLECTDISIIYSTSSQFQNPIIQILSGNTTYFTFCLIYITQYNAHTVYFTYNQDDIQLTSEQQFDGFYTNAFLSENSNFLFLINSEHIYIVDLTKSNEIQEVINSNILSQNDPSPISYFGICQITNNLFHIVFLQQQKLTSFFIDTNYNNFQGQVISYFLKEYQQIINMEVTLDNIVIITDTFIINLQLKDSIKAIGYQQLNSGTFALLNLLRNIVVIQDYQNIISTYIINEPQIFISEIVTKQIENIMTPVKLDILVCSQLNQKIMEYAFQIQLIQLDVTENQVPIQFHQYIDELILKYPEEKVIDRSQVFLGPNLTLSIQSSNPEYLSAFIEDTKFGEFTITNAIYSIACSFSKQEQIYCTQYLNDTIMLTIDNPTISQEKITIQAMLTLQKCSCIKTLSSINVLMQFKQSVLIQQFNHSLHPTQQLRTKFQMDIISAQILKDVLFVTTIDGKLTATDIFKQQQLFTISNYNLNEIYINQLDYPHYLFIDNLDQLIIIAYNGKQSYEFINSIPYPIQNYDSNSIGILNNGIYIAFSKQNNNFIYFYQKINIFLQNSVSNYFQVYIQEFQIYQNPKILSTYTSDHYYLIFIFEKSCYLSQLSGTGTSYTALRTSKYFIQESFAFTQMSAIMKQEPGYQVEIVYLFTNFDYSFNHPYISYDFMLTTRFDELEFIGLLYLKYKANNYHFSSYFHQNVSIIYDNYLLLPKNLHNIQTYQISDKGDIKINPHSLFYGNIQNYTVNCEQCQSINITQPIVLSNSHFLKIFVNNIINENNLIYLTDKKNSLYQFHPETNQLEMIYDLSEQANTNCYLLFIEMKTSFPVQICTQHSTIIYAYNISSNQLITHKLTEVCCYYESYYNNGILTVFSTGNFQALDYFAFYFWISDNQINLIQIYNSNGVCHYCLISPIYLSMSQNFTTQPCQIFGFIITFNEGKGNNEISLLKNCISPTMSQNFGFTPNKTTSSGNIYFQSSIWYLIQTEPVSFPFYKKTKQFGLPEQISDTIIQLKLQVTYFNIVDLYNVYINKITGTIISFVADQSFFISCLADFIVNQGSNGLLMIQCFQRENVFAPEIFSYEEQKFKLQYNTKKINKMIGFENINVSKSYALLSGNYYAFNYNITSQLFYVQNFLTLSLDLTAIQNTTIEITSQNPQNSIKQSIFVQNVNFNKTPANNDTINPTDSDVQQNSHHITLIILYSCMIVLLIVVLIAPKCCYNSKQIQKNTFFNFELSEK